MYFIEKAKDVGFFRRFDFWIFMIVSILCVLGLFVVKSAVLMRSDAGSRIMTMQLVGLVLGMICLFVVSKWDYKDLKTLAFVFYIFSTILLLMVLIFGTGDNLGSRSWFKIGGLNFQPAEIAKVSYIIILASYLEKLTEETKRMKENFINLLIFAFIPIILIFLQKDFGTMLVFLFILAVMLFSYGVKIRYYVILAAVFILSSPIIWFFVLNDKRRNRIKVFINPDLEPLGAGLNVLRSKMAIGSGQLFGKGLFQGPQTQNAFVPVRESDFIFSVIGEELGFIGAIVIITLVLLLILRMTYIALNARDYFGSYLVVGICAMFCFHYIENIGMTIGLLPVTGIPLPFISAGGSSLVSSLIAIGIVISVSMRRKKGVFK